MNVKTNLSLISILFAVYSGESKSCDNNVLLYQLLKCKGSEARINDCPSYYECPNYNVEKDLCRFQGKSFKLKETVENASPCNYDCRCDYLNENSTYPQIICANLFCPEIELGKHDYLAHEFHSCCPIKKSKFDTRSTCYVNGHFYNEGQRYYSTDSCQECICKGNKDENCRLLECNVELKYSRNIEQNCAPIYENSSQCCPSTFICPENVEDLNINPCKEDDDEAKFLKNYCKFGDYYYKRHNGFNATTNVICECMIPPLMSCYIKK